MLLDAGLRAIILVPLSNGDRRLGVLGFGFIQPYQPDDQALRFLRRVASEFAVSVDGYLARNALQQERDRTRVVFEITNALVSKLPMDERKRLVLLSITHKLHTQDEPQFDISESRHSAPHYGIAGRRVFPACKIASQPGNLREI